MCVHNNAWILKAVIQFYKLKPHKDIKVSDNFKQGQHKSVKSVDPEIQNASKVWH